MSKAQRLAGTRRFFKRVSIISTEAPWEIISKESATDNEGTNDGRTMISSPISAGVDGTNSASGVVNRPVSSGLANGSDGVGLDSLRWGLTPRNPKLFPRMSDTDSGSDSPDDAGLGGKQDRHWRSTQDEPGWYSICLDGRVLKTPLGQPLTLPSQLLAGAVAAEWDAQLKTIAPAQMPLMTLACTSIDQTMAARRDTEEQVLAYLATDTTCYWADATEDRVLHRNQTRAWNAVHDACEVLLGDRPAIATGATESLLMSRSRPQKGGAGLPHPDQVFASAKSFVEALDAWHLTALASITRESKSFLIGASLLTRGIDTKAAVEASRVEEEFQISNWGLVEGGHDYDRLNCSVQLHSSDLLVKALAVDNDFQID